MTKDELLAKLRSLIVRIENGALEVTGDGRMTDTGITVQSGWTIGKDAITFPRCEPSEEQQFLAELQESFPGMPAPMYGESDVERCPPPNSHVLQYWSGPLCFRKGTAYEIKSGILYVAGGSWEECKDKLRRDLDPLVRYIRGDDE